MTNEEKLESIGEKESKLETILSYESSIDSCMYEISSLMGNQDILNKWYMIQTQILDFAGILKAKIDYEKSEQS